MESSDCAGESASQAPPFNKCFHIHHFIPPPDWELRRGRTKRVCSSEAEWGCLSCAGLPAAFITILRSIQKRRQVHGGRWFTRGHREGKSQSQALPMSPHTPVLWGGKWRGHVLNPTLEGQCPDGGTQISHVYEHTHDAPDPEGCLPFSIGEGL